MAPDGAGNVAGSEPDVTVVSAGREGPIFPSRGPSRSLSPVASGSSRMTVSPSRFRTIAGWAIAAQIAIVITGSAVRLTGSGLGCTDWPGCSEDRFVPAWAFHDWIEFGNRLFSLAVVASTLVAVVGAHRRQPRRRDLVLLSWGLVLGVVAQAVLGAVLVVFHLDPRLNLGHFLLSMALIADAVVLHHRAAADTPAAGREGTSTPLVRRMAALLLFAAAVVVATGTVVTGSGPHGGDERADRFDFALHHVTQLHAGAMWVFAASLLALFVVARRSGSRAVRAPLELLLAVTAAQATLGYVQYALGVPAGLVSAHILGSCLVWSLTVVIALRTMQPTGLAAVPSDRGPIERDAVPVLSSG